MIKLIKISISVLLLLLTFSCQKDNDEPIIFVGDSLIAKWDVQYFFPHRNIEKKGIPGAKVNDILELNIDCTGRTCVMLIGTNNLSPIINQGTLSEDFRKSFIESYLKLIESLNAEKIILISLLPRNPDSFSTEIERLNNELENSISEYENVTFLNAFDSFTKEGIINESYYIDGLHLSYYGYEKLSVLLKKMI